MAIEEEKANTTENSEKISDQITKATEDFGKGQDYNRAHMIVTMNYKIFKGLFWIGFWAGEV